MQFPQHQCFRSFDSIEFFEVKVTLEKVADKSGSLLQVFSFAHEEEESALVQVKKKSMTFKWQQKVLSPSEIIEYSTNGELTGDYEKDSIITEYRKKAASMNQKDKIKAISAAKNDTDIESDELFLFTYTNRDNYIPPESTAPTTKWIKSPLVDKIENSRLPLAEIHPISSIDEKHIVDYRIHTMQPLLDDSFIEMNLMIYFPASTKSTKTAIKIGAPIELRLCRIRWYTSGLPGFAVGDKAHRIEHETGTYNLQIENASPDLSKEDQEKEWEIYQAFFKRNLLLRNKIVGDSFKQVPDLYWQKILLFGEIISAQNFKLNGNARLYIRYSWETHSEWKLSHEYNESLSTQRTLPFYEEERGIVTAHFGYPFEGCFYSKLQDSLDHPRLFIEVFSVDDWDRHCIQGYSFLRVPNAPGYTTFTIKTWKPLGTHHDQMRSFFIGGTRELADLKYLTIPDDFNGGVYSKYGMMTESSGQVEIRMNTVYQKSTKSRHVQEVVPENKGSHYGSGQLRAISEALLRARVRLDSLKRLQMLGDSEYGQVFLSQDPRLVGYKNRINLYSVPPPYQLNVELFEKLALDRLSILKAIETASIRNTLKKDKAYNPLILSIIKDLLPLSRNNLLKTSVSARRKELKKEIHEERKNDHISHFILRLAFCQSADLRSWFVKFETELFRIRIADEDKEDLEAVFEMAQFGGSTMNLSTFKPTSAEKLAHSQLVKDLERFYNFTDKEHQSQVFFKVPFERILDLVKGRQVIVRNGFAYVPRSTQTVLLINLFKDRLEASLEELAAVMPNIDDDDRVNSILSSLGKQHSSSVGNSFIAAEGKVKFTHADIDDLSLHHFAPCMKNLHLNLRENNHLKHFARLQYGLFLKGIGLPYEESLTFWRRAFKNMSDDQFQKGGHPYNIRHSYGLEGKRTNYTSYSCMKIITSNQPGAGDHHGCPFKHFSSDNLKPLLTGMISSATNLAPGSNQVQAHVLDVSNLSKSGHFQLACTKLFEITHQKPGAAPISIDTIEHPNQYFELSRNGVEGKSSGEVVVMDSSETVHHDVLMDASMDDLVFNDIDGSNDMMDNVDNNVETVNVADDLQAIETQENDEKMQDVEQVMEVDQVSNVEQEVVKMEVIELPKEEIMLDAQDTSEAVPAISSSKEEIMADVDSNEATKEKEQDERMQD